MVIKEEIFTLNDIADQILAIGNGCIDGKIRAINSRKLNCTLFLTTREAFKLHLFNKSTINQIVHVDQFIVGRYTPINLDLKKKYEIYAGNPIIELKKYRFELGFLNHIIINLLDSHESLDEKLNLLKQEPFMKNEIENMSGWIGKNAYSYADIIHIININDVANQILAVVERNDGINAINNLELQCIMFFVIKEAIEKNLFSYLEIDQLINKDGFYMNRVSPLNKEIQEKYAIFSASPIMVRKELNTNLDYLNELIIKNINNINNIKSSNIFEKLSLFYKNIIVSYKIKEIPENQYRSLNKFTLEEILNIKNN